jgi:hypothetical protein
MLIHLFHERDKTPENIEFWPSYVTPGPSNSEFCLFSNHFTDFSLLYDPKIPYFVPFCPINPDMYAHCCNHTITMSAEKFRSRFLNTAPEFLLNVAEFSLLYQKP